MFFQGGFITAIFIRLEPALKTVYKMLYEFGREFCYHRFILKCAETGVIPTEFHEVLNNIASLPIAEFPLKGRDLISAGVEDNRKIGQMLKMLEHLWIEGGFSMSKDELLAHVHGKLKEALYRSVSAADGFKFKRIEGLCGVHPFG